MSKKVGSQMRFTIVTYRFGKNPIAGISIIDWKIYYRKVKDHIA